ncbi:MAG: hypothetical protein KBT21_00725 [Treponema sp.]|nr:hypothetical protein [Candidatus Treponema merdequi]
MKRIEKIFKSVILILLFSFAIPAFAEVKILSPATSQGRVWSNRQVLLINATEDEEIFYSFSDQDPLTSGFAYDGPVSLDLNGSVKLNIATVKDKKRIDYILNYDVDESKINNLTTLEEKKFIEMLSESSVYNLKCGEELAIPETFDYVISSNNIEEDFETGRTVSISKDSNLERYLTLTLRSRSNDLYNFVIHVVPDNQVEFTQNTVPFEIEQWSVLKLKDKKYIYTIDDGWWQGAGKEIPLDRTKSHIIKWQDVDYDITNPVLSYEIPPVPSVRAETLSDSTVVISLNGDQSYRFAKGDKYLNNYLPQGLFKTITVDAFQGENFSALLPLSVYSENVLQGTLYVSVQVNRKMPKSPDIIISNSANEKNLKMYRDDVSVSFAASKEDYEIKYLIEGPFYKKNDDIKCTEYDLSEHDDDILNFESYKGQNIILKAEDEKPCAYKIYSYVIDKSDNVSKTISEFVQIDKCNFFVNANASSNSIKIGTLEYPFDSLDDIEKLVNNRKFTNLFVEGEISFCNKPVSLKQNVKISGDENTKVKFSENAEIIMNNASLQLENIIFESIENETSDKNNLIVLNNSTLEILNSEINFDSLKNATLIDARKASVLIINSGLTASASEYASLISGLSSKISISECRFVTNAATNVNISVKKSTLSVKNSECKVNGNASRIAELYSSDGIFDSCLFVLENCSQKSDKNTAVWKDKNSRFSKYSSISLKGFSN